MKTQVIEAAQTYVVINKDNPDTKYDPLRKVVNKCGCLEIGLDTLIDEGFLMENNISSAFKNNYYSVYFNFNVCSDQSSAIMYGYQYSLDTCSCYPGQDGCTVFHV